LPIVVTYRRYYSNCEEKGFGEGPRVGPVIGGVKAIITVVFDDEELQGIQVFLDLKIFDPK